MSSEEPTLIQDQLVLARSKLWTPELDKLMRRWKKQVEVRRRGHYELTSKFAKRHYLLGVPSTILSTIVSTGILSTFRNCGDGQNGEDCDMDQWIRFSVGIVGLCSTALTAVLTFVNYQEAANEHKNAADSYEILHGTIESLLVVPALVRGDPVSTLQSIRTTYDETVRKSPNLPSIYQVDLSFITVDQPQNRQIAPQLTPTDFGFSLKDETSKSSINMLRSIVDDDNNADLGHSSLTDSDNLVAKIAEENNFDSEDDSREVCIAFDLDHMAALNNTPTALAVANIVTQRDKQVQESLRRALEFERSRLTRSTGEVKSLKTSESFIGSTDS